MYLKTPEPRHALPFRRLVHTHTILTEDGTRIELSVGYDPQDVTRPREVFYAAGFKTGSMLEFQIQDACVLVSLLLQHGHTPERIAKSLSSETAPDGSQRKGSHIGLILEALL